MTRTEAKATRTGTLLEELIRIAGISKKDFAEALSISQNVLSRILTGQRLVQFNEKSRLSRDAAEVLAPAVYGFNCYLKLGDLFPLIYDFASEHELHVFLEDAIEFAIEFDLMEAQQAGLPFPEYERVWLGRRRMLNLFCIIMSGLIREKNGDELRLPCAHMTSKILLLIICCTKVILRPSRRSGVTLLLIGSILWSSISTFISGRAKFNRNSCIS